MLDLSTIFQCIYIYHTLEAISGGRCDTAKDTWIFTIKHQMSGPEFARDFYLGKKIVKFTDDYKDWRLYNYWQNDSISMANAIKINYLEDWVPTTITLKHMKDTDKSLTIEKEIGMSQVMLLDAIPTPIPTLSCKDLYYEFLNSVAYTLHFTNEQNIRQLTIQGPSYLLIISGKLRVALQQRSTKHCSDIFQEGELIYIPYGFNPCSLISDGKFLAVKMSWKPNLKKTTVHCSPLTLKSVIQDSTEGRNSSLSHDAKSLSLNTGFYIPPIGLGMHSIGNNKSAVISKALKIGYKLFHIVKSSSNVSLEHHLRTSMEKTKTKRDEIFISIKVNLTTIDFKGGIKTSLIDSLEDLNSSYIDLVLLELPHNEKDFKKIHATVNDLTVLKKRGIVRSIGVSNIENAAELDLINSMAENTLSVVENWFDLLRPDEEIRRYCKELGIRYMAYGIFGFHRMRVEKTTTNSILGSVDVRRTAQKYHTSTSSLLLMWAIEKEIITNPSTSDEYHLESNLYSKGTRISHDGLRKKMDKMAKLRTTKLLSRKPTDHDTTPNYKHEL